MEYLQSESSHLETDQGFEIWSGLRSGGGRIQSLPDFPTIATHLGTRTLWFELLCGSRHQVESQEGGGVDDSSTVEEEDPYDTVIGPSEPLDRQLQTRNPSSGRSGVA